MTEYAKKLNEMNDFDFVPKVDFEQTLEKLENPWADELKKLKPKRPRTTSNQKRKKRARNEYSVSDEIYRKKKGSQKNA